MPYAIETTKHFERLIRKPDPATQGRLSSQVSELALAPYVHKALTGELRGLYSLRVGDYRVVYTVDERAKKVRLLNVAHRRAVYR